MALGGDAALVSTRTRGAKTKEYSGCECNLCTCVASQTCKKVGTKTREVEIKKKKKRIVQKNKRKQLRAHVVHGSAATRNLTVLSSAM
jgi:hypothetical protein